MERTDISARKIPTVRQARGNPLLVTLARAAQSVLATGETRYVFATANGYEISDTAPAFGQRHYEFTPTGRYEVA